MEESRILGNLWGLIQSDPIQSDPVLSPLNFSRSVYTRDANPGFPITWALSTSYRGDVNEYTNKMSIVLECISEGVSIIFSYTSFSLSFFLMKYKYI